MSPRVRTVVGAIAGVLTACVIILIMEQLTLKLYPMPEGMDPTDIEAHREYARVAPAGALGFVLLGYALAAVAGGLVAALICHRRRAVLVVSGLLVVASVANLSTIPHPLWFWAANLVGVALLPLVGAMLAPRVRPRI